MQIKESFCSYDDISEPKTLFRLYIGNLKQSCPEDALRSLFSEHGVEVGSILVKRSYAFVDCPDQANVDLGIDKLNGKYNVYALICALKLVVGIVL